MGFSELLISVLAIDSDEKEYAAAIFQAGLRAANLVDQILNFSRTGDPQLVLLPLPLVVDDALNMLSVTLPATIKMRRDIDPASASVFCNETQIHQIVLNLCNNAYHAMESQGRGTLQIRLSDEQNIKNLPLSLQQTKKRYVSLSVSDSGTGIPAEIQEQVFEPFFTTKEIGKGTGLGLSVVYGIVKQLQGEITIDSEPGAGTVITVYLPASEGELKETNGEPEISILKNAHILVVDDDVDLATFYKRALESLGFTVQMLNDSVKALELFREQPERFDLVFTDQTMPGLTGVELSKEILSTKADQTIILATGHADFVLADDARSSGIKAVLYKPVSIKKLKELIHKYQK